MVWGPLMKNERDGVRFFFLLDVQVHDKGLIKGENEMVHTGMENRTPSGQQ